MSSSSRTARRRCGASSRAARAAPASSSSRADGRRAGHRRGTAGRPARMRRCARRRCRRRPDGADAMFSAIFVDRPRLAIVIAIVTTIAGPAGALCDPGRAISRYRPAAGLGHDILSRRQCRGGRRDRRPADRGAGRRRRQDDLHEERERRRRQLHADRLVRTRHQSRHQHRQRQQPRADRAVAAAAGGSAAGRHGQEEVVGAARRASPSIRRSTPTTRCSCPTTSRSTCSTRSRARPASATRTLWGPQDYAMRAWVRTDRLTGLNLTTGDIINAIQSQNIQAAVGRIGARPISNDQQLQLNIQTKGPPDLGRGIREHRHPHQSGRLDAAARRRRAARTRRRQSRPRHPVQRRPRRGDRDLPVARRQRDRHAQGGARHASPSCEKRFPEDLAWKVTYDPTVFVTDTIHEVQKTLIEAFVLVVHRRLPVPRQRARDADPDPRRAGQPDRHLHRAQGRRLFRQHRVAARHRARDRHRRRRRHRGGRERRARDGGASRALARGGDQAGDGGNHRADHRDHAGAAVGVRAGGLHSRHFRRIVPAVRGDRRGRRCSCPRSMR